MSSFTNHTAIFPTDIIGRWENYEEYEYYTDMFWNRIIIKVPKWYIFDGNVFEKKFDLTTEQTELWWENDSYVIDVLCQANGFTRETIQVETQAPIEEEQPAEEVEPIEE